MSREASERQGQCCNANRNHASWLLREFPFFLAQKEKVNKEKGEDRWTSQREARRNFRAQVRGQLHLHVLASTSVFVFDLAPRGGRRRTRQPSDKADFIVPRIGSQQTKSKRRNLYLILCRHEVQRITRVVPCPRTRRIWLRPASIFVVFLGEEHEHHAHKKGPWNHPFVGFLAGIQRHHAGASSHGFREH